MGLSLEKRRNLWPKQMGTPKFRDQREEKPANEEFVIRQESQELVVSQKPSEVWEEGRVDCEVD